MADADPEDTSGAFGAETAGGPDITEAPTGCPCCCMSATVGPDKLRAAGMTHEVACRTDENSKHSSLGLAEEHARTTQSSTVPHD